MAPVSQSPEMVKEEFAVVTGLCEGFVMIGVFGGVVSFVQVTVTALDVVPPLVSLRRKE